MIIKEHYFVTDGEVHELPILVVGYVSHRSKEGK